MRLEKYLLELKAKAGEVRDALAKGLYGRLFRWLVRKINESMAERKTEKTIGILDIFG